MVEKSVDLGEGWIYNHPNQQIRRYCKICCDGNKFDAGKTRLLKCPLPIHRSSFIFDNG